jgi:predicted AAA+ superfamily ATPase
MYQRPYIKLVKDRILEERKFIQVIYGPRQVGKSTLINQLLKEISIPYHYVSADAINAAGFVWLEQVWETARLKMAQSGAKEYLLVIDEIQKIDKWSETAKLNWDKDTRENRWLKLVLLGSSRLLLQQGLTESLAGRFETIYMGHWSFTEMHDAFGWDTKMYAWFGGYPGSAALIHDERRWKSYVLNSLIETSISKDILMLTRVDKPALMKRLFELGCLYSGQILSYNKMIGQYLDAGNTTTLAHYLYLLNTAGLLAGLQKYSRNAIRERSSSPKFQVHNTALISAQRNESLDEVYARPDLWGRVVESVIGAHLLNSSLMNGYQLYYWRKENDEVDFVLNLKGKIIGLEIKSGNTEKTSGLAAFQNEIHPDKILLIGNSGISWEEFLKADIEELL